MIEEFHNHCASAQESDCKMLLELNNVNPDDWYIYALVLVGIFVIFRSLAVIFLRAKALP
jgi:hypothetical protein